MICLFIYPSISAEANSLEEERSPGDLDAVEYRAITLLHRCNHYPRSLYSLITSSRVTFSLLVYTNHTHWRLAFACHQLLVTRCNRSHCPFLSLITYFRIIPSYTELFQDNKAARSKAKVTKKEDSKPKKPKVR